MNHPANQAAAIMQRSAPERLIQSAITDYLGYTGWLVVETSQPWRVANGLVGVPDVIAWKAFGLHSVTLFVEVKTVRGKLRASQVEFMERLRPLLCPTLWHCVARSVDDVIEMVDVIARANKEI